jgi:hypothetical protein
MNIYRKSFKLILAGNTKVPAMIAFIITGTLQARNNTQDSSLIFRQVHVFHTEQLLQALTASTSWQEALKYYEIFSTSLVHYVAKIEDSNVDRFRDLVEQLQTIINPLDNAHNYVDLTSGISSLKFLLSLLMCLI